MFFHRKRREVPGLNTTSTADISFMLLIFFLVTTSMDADKGMGRKLPPLDPDQQQEQMDVDRSKVMTLRLAADGTLTLNEQPADVHKIKRQLKEFIVRTGPEHILELQTDRDCSYDDYFTLQNEIVRSYREIRDAAAKQRYACPFSQCNEEQRESLNADYPQRIQELY